MMEGLQILALDQIKKYGSTWQFVKPARDNYDPRADSLTAEEDDLIIEVQGVASSTTEFKKDAIPFVRTKLLVAYKDLEDIEITQDSHFIRNEIKYSIINFETTSPADQIIMYSFYLTI